MRQWMNIVEGVSPPATLFHGTSAPIEGTSFRPLTHFGTLLAALTRSRLIHSDCYIYEIALQADSPLKIRDGKNWNHGIYKLVDQLSYTTHAISDAERYEIMSAEDELMAQRLIEVLHRKGGRGLRVCSCKQSCRFADDPDLLGPEVHPRVLTMVECWELGQSLLQN